MAKDTFSDQLYGPIKMLNFGLPKLPVRDGHQEDLKRLFLDFPNELPEWYGASYLVRASRLSDAPPQASDHCHAQEALAVAAQEESSRDQILLVPAFPRRVVAA